MTAFRFEEFELDTATLQLRRGDETVPVEPQVFDVLVHLLEHRDRVISKEELLDEVWGNRFVSESALTSRIKSARRAVGDDGRAQRLIKNFHGRGYRFIGEVLVGAAAVGETAVDETVLGGTGAGARGTDAGSPSSDGASPAADLPAGDAPVVAVDGLGLMVDDEFPFVGRADVLGQAVDHLDAVRSGRPAAILVGAEPGLGKTRLATEIARRAATDGVHAIGGRCDRHLATSLQPWLEAVAAWVSASSIEAITLHTSGLTDHLRPVLPVLDTRLPGSAGLPAAAADEFATLDALVVLLERISSVTPMVVVLDDVQWAGGATRALASMLIRRGSARVLLVLTFRSNIDDLDDTARDWLHELAGHPGNLRIDLAPLDATDVATLAASADVADDLAEQVAELSAGHALFATELLRDVRLGTSLPHLPDTVAELVRSRLQRLPRPVSALVGAGAAIGPDFPLDVAGIAAELDPIDALEAMEVALDAELVHEVDGSADRFRFSHQLVPAAVLDSMSRARRVRLHQRLAAEFESLGASAATVAHHLLESAPLHDVRQLAARVRKAADDALADHHHDTAVNLLGRAAALRLPARLEAEVLVDLGNACNAAGRQPQSLEPFSRTAALAREHGWDDLLVASALGRWGQTAFRASRDRTVIPLLDEAIALGDAVEPEQMARLLAKRAAFTMFVGPLEERDAISAEAVRLVGEEPRPARLEVLEARWLAIACPATFADLPPLDREIAELRRRLQARPTDACAPEIVPYCQGDGDRLWEILAELEADPRQRRDVDQWRAMTLRGTRALFQGDTATARELADAAYVLGREPWGESGRVNYSYILLVCDLFEGAPDRSLETWREIASAVPSDPMRSTVAWIEALAGHTQVALDTVDDIAPRLSLLRENFMGGFGLVAFAEACLALGAERWYPSLIENLEPSRPHVLGHPWAPMAAAADLLARLHHALDDPERAAAEREVAEGHYASLGAASFAAALDAALASTPET